MANTYLGSTILWGTQSITGTITGIGPLTLIEGADNAVESDKEEVRNKAGNVSQVTYYNQRRTASLRVAVNQGIVTLPTPGSTLAITDTGCPELSVTWCVEKASLARTNTKAAMASIDLIRYLDGDAAIP